MAQQAPRLPDQYVFTVSPQDAEKIGAALALRPLGEVRDLYQKLQNQAQEQNAKANLPTLAEPPKAQ